MEKSTSSTLMTEGSIWKKIIAFAVPLFLGNLFQQLYNTADSLIVGNFLGSNALAAVSSSGNLIFLMVGFVSGIAIGAGVVIARYYGAGRHGDVHLQAPGRQVERRAGGDGVGLRVRMAASGGPGQRLSLRKPSVGGGGV